MGERREIRFLVYLRDEYDDGTSVDKDDLTGQMFTAMLEAGNAVMREHPDAFTDDELY